MKENYTIPLLHSSRMQDQSFVAQFVLPERGGLEIQELGSPIRKSEGRRSRLGIQKHQGLVQPGLQLKASLSNTFLVDLVKIHLQRTER